MISRELEAVGMISKELEAIGVISTVARGCWGDYIR